MKRGILMWLSGVEMVVEALVRMASSGKDASAPANPAQARGIEVQWRSIRVGDARRRKKMHERAGYKVPRRAKKLC